MKKLIKNSKFRKAISVTSRIIGTISFLFVMYAVFTNWIVPQDPVVAPVQVTRQMDSDPSYLPEHVIIKAKVEEIRKVPLYGYTYKVADNMYIVNFSRWDLRTGDTVRFRMTGAVKIGDAYLVNADYE